MTILSKDQLQMVTTRTYVQTGGYRGTTTLLSVDVETIGGIDGGLPVVENYPLNMDELDSGIRLLTQAEYDVLKQHLVGSMTEPEASTELHSYLYKDTLGTPLMVIAYQTYYAAWYDYHYGVGFYKFKGYDPGDPILQTIDVASIRRVY